MNQITLIVDKSAFQGLSPQEAKWLFHHFRLNFPPVFFAEVLADLTKRIPTTSSPEGDVVALARKIVTYAVHPNVAAMDILRAELQGHPIPLRAQIVDQQAEVFKTPDGEKGILIDSTPIQELLERWAKGDFETAEKDFARVWREGISQIKLEELFRTVKVSRQERVNSAVDVLSLVDGILSGRDYENFKHALEIVNAPPEQIEAAMGAWRRNGKPPIRLFIPYTFFTLRIELFFLIGLAHQVISTRDTNRIDIEYLKYLPFTQVFCSSDKLHIDSAPDFLMDHNQFIAGADLKVAMRQIADYWDQISEETRSLGTATYANVPPPELDNAVTRVFDFYMPEWRTDANKPRPKISPEENARIMAEIRPMMEAMAKRSRK
jgi:hypothetical protein